MEQAKRPSSAQMPEVDIEPYLRSAEKKLAIDAVAQAAWAEKKWVWVENKDEGYVAASIIAENGEEVTLEYTDGKVGLSLLCILKLLEIRC